MDAQFDPRAGFYKQIKTCHRRILDCFLRGDPMGARRETVLDILGMGDFMADISQGIRFVTQRRCVAFAKGR